MDCRLLTYTLLPIRFVTFLGIAAALVSLAYALVVVLQWLFTGSKLFPGLSLLVTELTFFSGCILLSLGIMGEYLGRVYREVLGRPRYLIKDALNFPEEDQGRSAREEA